MFSSLYLSEKMIAVWTGAEYQYRKAYGITDYSHDTYYKNFDGRICEVEGIYTLFIVDTGEIVYVSSDAVYEGGRKGMRYGTTPDCFYRPHISHRLYDVAQKAFVE